MKWLLVLLLVPAVGAISEAEAPQLDEQVVAVGHSPDIPAPSTQWTGFLELAPGNNVTAVRYQICIVGEACFAGPTPAQLVGDNRWEFDTQNYGIAGQPVEWGIDEQPREPPVWRVGVKYFLLTDDDDHGDVLAGRTFPPQHDCLGDEGKELGWVACEEQNYIAFDMPSAVRGDMESPGLPAIMLIALLALAARLRK